MAIMAYNFELDDKATIESLKILTNQCWKILPIFEGKNINKIIVYSREEAYENYQKHLIFLTTKVSGATKIWRNNQYYVELLYLLEGLRDRQADEHEQVRLITLHCINLIKEMKKVVLDNA